MGFFKDFKEDLSETAGDLGDIAKNSDNEDFMVNTLDVNVNDVQTEKSNPPYAAEESVEHTKSSNDNNDKENIISDETSVITQGLVVTGDLSSPGSIDVYGRISGNVTCKGKLTVSGSITGDSSAEEIFADGAKIDGNLTSRASVKIGQDTVVLGNISASSAVIAGAVKGDIDIKGPVIVDSTAVIVGDIKSKTVQVNNGATIDGRCSQCYSDINSDEIFGINTKKK